MNVTPRRKGQKKPDGSKAILTPTCPKCGENPESGPDLKRTYTRKKINGKWQYVPFGWSCPNEYCDYIIKDYVELA